MLLYWVFFFQPEGKGKRLPEVYCMVSRLGCFNLFSKVSGEVIAGFFLSLGAARFLMMSPATLRGIDFSALL